MSNPDVKALIRSITEEVLRKTAQSVQEKIYRDEPIIFTASQMKNYIPDEIREMKKLASEPGAYYQTEACVFYRQAKFMENYEDDFEYKGNFFTYYPTYQKMSADQLRGYFSWRSKVRRGEIEKTSLSFAYVYIYELINMIGSDSPEEGFSKFKNFCDVYGNLEPQILRYTKTWLTDFVVYYDLDKALLGDMADQEFYRAASVFNEHETHSDQELFEAICAVSSYNIKNYKLYKNDPDDVRNVVCKVFRGISEYYDKKNKKSISEKLFGKKVGIYYHMFESAIFYDNKKYTDYIYEINDSYKFTCKDGRWGCEKYYGNQKSQWLGDILKTIDSIMRQKLDFGNPINCPIETKWILKIIHKEIDELIENKNKNAAPKIEIDISKLAGIRKSADVTRDKLILGSVSELESSETPMSFAHGCGSAAEPPFILPTKIYDFEAAEGGAANNKVVCSSGQYVTEEEQTEQEEFSEPEIPEATGEISPEISPANNTPLDDNEYEFMHFLLYGGSFESKIMPSILADSVNEKLFDEFGDVVIIFEGDKPEIIEDYAGDLKGMIPE